jgi:4-amino-4-deoxy-L-arabinose transferase-like glycosyltransferase
MTEKAAKRPVDLAPRLSHTHAVVLLIVACTALRILVASGIGLEDDGVYSVVQARHPAFGYFDHPPMHYWLIWLTVKVTGSEAPLVLRLPFIALNAGCSWLIFRITALAFDRRAGFWAAALFNLAGIFTLAFSFFILPDGPLFFFALLAVRLLIPVLFGRPDSRTAMLHWLGAGAAAGAALLSKYSAVFLFVGVFSFLLTAPRQRKWLGRPAPWAAAMLAAVMFLPVLYWNSQHHWASFVFQGERALLFPVDMIHRFIHLFENIGRQAFFLIPWLYVPMVYVLGRAIARGPGDERRWLFACLAAWPVVVFTAINLVQGGLPHWTLSGWLFVFPLLGQEIVTRKPGWYGHARRAAIATAVGLVVIAGALVIEAQTGVYGAFMSREFPALQQPIRDPMLAFYLWDALPGMLRQRGLLDARVKFIAGIDWHDSAKLDYELGHSYPVLCLGIDRRGYALRDATAFAGAAGLLIDVPNQFARAPQLDALFARRERLDDIVLMRDGRPAITLRVERVSGFRPQPL